MEICDTDFFSDTVFIYLLLTWQKSSSESEVHRLGDQTVTNSYRKRILTSFMPNETKGSSLRTNLKQ